MFGYYCDRCDRNFKHENALDQHERDSQSHWRCPECEFDGYDRGKLIDHYHDSGCRLVYEGCCDGAGRGWVEDSDEYWEHVADDHVCTTCGRHFDNENNLRHHEIKHRSATIECLACLRKFTTYGGMIIHLESGACESDIDVLDLNKSAAMCYQWRSWILEEFRDDLRDHVDIEQEGWRPFKCPTCDAEFPKLSSLFMHDENTTCEQENEYMMKKLKRWLWKRHHKGYHR